MRSATLVNGTDLVSWASRRDAQSTLPQLLRRLIHATVTTARCSSFPAGEGVQLSGWDGKLVAERGNAFVPDGASVWEMSVERNIKSKADDDYLKRLQSSNGIDRQQTTFIFVTPRRWPGKDTWAAARQAENVWQEVRAYDADTLEEWLETAPAVHIWFSILFGKRPQNAADLESFWDDWSLTTRPAIPPEFVLAGRDEVAERIHGWLLESTTPLPLRAESRDEALSIFAATLQQLPLDERIEHFSRTLVVRDLSSWEQLAAFTDPLILVPTFDDPNAIARATRLGHKVVIPLGHADSESGSTVNAPRISWEGATKVLIACGFSEERARDLATLAGRSLTSFRRKLALSPEVQRPNWASPAEARSLLPAMLAGAWNDSSEGDREVLSRLAQVSYEAVSRIVVRWSNEMDPPIRRIGSTWFVISKEDAWSLLARHLTLDDIKRFEEVALDVLSAPNPRFDLAEDQRWMAQALGHAPRHSELLCENIADTLALMGTRSSPTSLSDTGASVSDHARYIVRQLLARANTDWRLWASLSRTLPLIAEAAPDVFLEAAEGGLKGEEPVLLKLFVDNRQDPLFSSSPHTGLLWALETLAWSQEHLGRVAILLAKLTRLDPGGKLSNRPKSSFLEVFLPWHPQTTATLDQRLRVLDLVREREPVVAWQLMHMLLPGRSSIASSTARPKWREWLPESLPGVTNREYFKAVGEISRRMLADVGEIGAQWQDLIEALPNLPLEQHEAVLERLTSLDLVRLQPQDRTVIWNALRELISSHRSFHDANWALPKERVDRLDEVFRRFEPQETAARYGWLFDDVPALPEGREGDWEVHQKIVAKAQREAIQIIYTQDGIGAVIDLVGSVKRPHALGITLGLSELAIAEEDSLLCEQLTAVASRGQFARGFTVGRIVSRGRQWAEAKLAAIGKELSSAQRAEFLTCFPNDSQTWELAESWDEETQRHFWRLIPPFGINDADVERVARKFLKYGRPVAAVEMLAYHVPRLQSPPTELVTDALECMLRTAPEDDKPSNGFSYHLSELLDVLSKSTEVDESRIARLEWALLPVLSRRERNPRLLHRELGRNPDFFAEIITWVFRAEGEESRHVSEEEGARAERAHELLESWRTLPGTTDAGTIDVDVFKDWVRGALKATATKGRGTIGEQKIGEVLSGSPRGSDGAWPHEAVRDMIEECASANLERGVEIGLYNSRGVVQKSLTEGGAQERQLVAQYSGFASSISDRWPRTAAILRGIADAYRTDAKRGDQQVELRQALGF